MRVSVHFYTYVTYENECFHFKSKIWHSVNFGTFAGLRRPVYFQYEMGTADTVSRTVDALLNDWAQIVHLYSIVHDLAEYFKMGTLYIQTSHNYSNQISHNLCHNIL